MFSASSARVRENGDKGQEDFENCAVMGRIELNVASDDINPALYVVRTRVPTFVCRQTYRQLPPVYLSYVPIAKCNFLTLSSYFQCCPEILPKADQEGHSRHLLVSQLQLCDSTSAIISVLQDQVREFEFDNACNDDEGMTKWLTPTVNVLCAFSAVVSGGVSLVSLEACDDVNLSYMICSYFRLRVSSLQELASSFRQVS